MSSDANKILVQPFKGYVPPPNLAQKLVAPPYDVIDTDEAREMAKGNEVSFLRVNKPEIDLPAETDPYDAKVYEMGRTNLEEFIKKGYLKRDEKNTFYIYSQTMFGKEQFGLVGECSAKQYEDNLILKHEKTRQKKEDDRTRLTNTQSANVGPIFLCYNAVSAIDKIVSDHVSKNKPYFDVTTDDKIVHKLWKLDNPDTLATIQKEFADNVPKLYVADGHHRTASAWRVYKERKEALGDKYTGKEDFNNFLAVLFPGNQLRILDYNRVVHDLAGLTPEQFLEALNKDWNVKSLNLNATQSDGEEIEKFKSQKHNDFRMYLHGKGWYELQPKDSVIKSVSSDVVKRLDVSILTDYCLTPILKIGDLRSDERIDFVGGIRGYKALKAKVDKQGGGVAFGLYPTSVEDLMAIADAGEIMPPKSTWFEPKLRSGVVVRTF